MKYLFLVLFSHSVLAATPLMVPIQPSPPPTTSPYYTNGHYMGNSQSVNGGTSYYNKQGQVSGQNQTVPAGTTSYYYDQQGQYHNVDPQP